MSQRDTVIHLIAGGTAGTVGAIVTCPLEVVKTRLQSSTSGFYLLPPPPPPSAPSSNLSSLSSSVTTSKISENSSRFTPYHHHYQQFSHYHHLHHHHHHHHHHHQKPQHQQHHHPRHHRTWSTIVRPSAQQKIRRLSSTNSSRYSRYAIAALSSQYSGEIRRNGISVPTTAGVTTTPAASAPHLAIRSTATITNGQYHYHSKLFPSKPYQHHRHHLHNSHLPPPSQRSPGLIHCLRYIVKYEGVGALFKGLGPNLVGVAPSRAIYFCTYSQSKSFFNSNLPTAPDSAMVHVFSAACAGFMACTATNPIWFVKTRLQLDHSHAPHNRSSAIECIKKIYRQSGYLGFYKGIVASYVGISETVIHFVIYEAVKSWLIKSRARDSIKNNSNFKDNNNSSSTSTKTSRDFVEFMAAGALSKTVASCIAYPHEVIRTRLREEGTKYKRFWQTLNTVYTEESIRGLYRGLTTQLVRQIPNTAIMMATYECVVYVLKRKFQPSSDKFTSVSNTSNTSNNKNTENLSTNTTTSPTNTTSPSSSSTQLRYSSKNKQKGEFISH